MIDRVWLTAILFFAAAVFGTLALALMSEGIRGWWRRARVAKRLRPVLEGGPDGKAGDVHSLIRSDSGESRGLPVGGMAGVIPGLRNLGPLLEQSRVGWSLWTFLMITVGLGFGLGGGILILTDNLIFATLGAAGGAIGPYIWVLQKQRGRFRRFEEEFPESIDLLTRAIRAGHPLSSGMRMVAEEGPPEVAEEFRRTFEEQRFGLPFDEALLGMVDRTDMVDVRIFAIAVLVQREVGGNLAEILENLSTTIRRRFYLRRQLRVYTAQGRMTGYALAALPVFLGFIIFLLQPEYIMVLFTTLLGWFLVGTALVMQLIGALWIRKIIDIEM
jgi:tight adherence protein B